MEQTGLDELTKDNREYTSHDHFSSLHHCSAPAEKVLQLLSSTVNML